MNPTQMRILRVMVHLKSLGYRESTLLAMDRRLNYVAKYAVLDDPEAVKRFVSDLDSSEGWKSNLIGAYSHYVAFYGLEWTKPYYKRVERMPKIAREEDINKIISHASRKYGLAYSILRDTGMRPIELTWLRSKHIDLENGRVYPGSAKHGSGRVLQLKPSTLAMFKRYMSQNDITESTQIWPSTKRLRENWCRLRMRLSKKLAEPRLNQIKLYDLRHHYATKLYCKTKDIVHVQRQLGHKNIVNTLRYVGLINLDEQEYLVRVASDVRESTQLLEQGFGFVAVIEQKYVFRKPKLPSFFRAYKSFN